MLTVHELTRSLGNALPDPRASELAEALLHHVRSEDDPEASVRWSSDGSLRGGRMMLERSDEECARLIAEAFEVPWSSACQEVVAVARELGLPLIVGWDVGGREAMLKLYVNASDASGELRRQVQQRLGLVGVDSIAVVGLNVTRTQREVKAYLQERTLSALNGPVPPVALQSFTDGAAWVLSSELRDGVWQPKALFVAVAESAQERGQELLLALTNTPWSDFVEQLPFAPGAIRQIGWGMDGTVTVYAKRAGGTPKLNTLLPHAVFQAPDCEVGLYVEPSQLAPRAFARTERHALSFRTRHGTVDPTQLQRLGQWATARVRAAEHAGNFDFDAPPPPWSRVE